MNVILDQPLIEGLSTGDKRGKEKLQEKVFMKRVEVVQKLMEHMEVWYEIRGGGRKTELRSVTSHLLLRNY